MPSVNDYKAMQRRAYVNTRENWTKVILGKDEYQITIKGQHATVAKGIVMSGNFNAKDVEPAVICETVSSIRKRLALLDAKMKKLYDEAPVSEGFRKYSREFYYKTDAIAFEITDILKNGINEKGAI